MRAFLYDTAVFLYALGREHAYRDPCRRIVKLATSCALTGDASVGLIHEFVQVRLRRTGDHVTAVGDGRAVAELCRLHAVERRDLALALELVERHQLGGVRDGIFAATASNRGIDAILSPDRAFDAIDGLERIDPADEQAVERLGV